MNRKQIRIELVALLLAAAFALATRQEANAAGCPAGTVKIGEKRTETADAIIVQPICKKVATIPKDCPPGSSVVGSGCMRDTAMRAEPSKKEKLAALRRQAWKELDEIRYHGSLVSWEGIWTLLGKPPVSEASSTAEDESREMRERSASIARARRCLSRKIFSSDGATWSATRSSHARSSL